MKRIDVKSSTYIDSSKKINDEDGEFKIDDVVRISKYQKAIFQISLKKLCYYKS